MYLISRANISKKINVNSKCHFYLEISTSNLEVLHDICLKVIIYGIIYLVTRCYTHTHTHTHTHTRARARARARINTQ